MSEIKSIISEECLSLMNRLNNLSMNIAQILEQLPADPNVSASYERALLIEKLTVMEASNFQMFPQLSDQVSPSSPWTTQSLLRTPQIYIDRLK